MLKYGEVRSGKKEFHFSTLVDGDNIMFSFINHRTKGNLDIPLKRVGNGELMIDTVKLIEEDKSGISKAIKIVKYDLGNENNFIRIVTDDPNNFIIEVAINVDNLTRNETNINS